MPYIYKITNDINGKVYIGKTAHSIKRRWQEHCRSRKRRNYEQRPLYSAMNKYGIEHFHIEQLEECSIEELNDRETYWIKECDAYHNGYNATIGGDGKFYLDYDKIYQTYQEVKTCKKTAEILGCSEYSVRNILKEVYHISADTLKWNAKHSLGKPVAMIDKNTMEVLNVFYSAEEAGRFLGKPGRHIQQACAGERQSAYGYYWSYATE